MMAVSLSAIGRNAPGGIRPATGWFQRTSASSFFSVFGLRDTTGWNSSTSSLSAMARSSRSADSDWLADCTRSSNCSSSATRSGFSSTPSTVRPRLWPNARAVPSTLASKPLISTSAPL